MAPEAASLLDAKGVDAGYGTMQVLWGVNLDVRPGETVLLLGANGAGKTTTLKAISGILRAERGEVCKGSIEFDGKRIDGIAQAGLQRHRLAQVADRLLGPPQRLGDGLHHWQMG